MGFAQQRLIWYVFRQRVPCFHGPRALRLGHKRKDKNSVHNLPYGPRTRLIRGINTICTINNNKIMGNTILLLHISIMTVAAENHN